MLNFAIASSAFDWISEIFPLQSFVFLIQGIDVIEEVQFLMSWVRVVNVAMAWAYCRA